MLLTASVCTIVQSCNTLKYKNYMDNSSYNTMTTSISSDEPSINIYERRTRHDVAIKMNLQVTY